MNSMKHIWSVVIVLGILIIGAGLLWGTYRTSVTNPPLADIEVGSFLKGANFQNIDSDLVATATVSARNKKKPTTPPVTSSGSFIDEFTVDNRLEETGSLTESASPYWWVNSGGRLISSLGTGKTIQGDLSSTDRWYQEYARSNPVDTDGGLHPQNIFRLVQRGPWKNFNQQVYFKVNKINLSSSPNRAASNGLFLFNRYQSGDSLYYTGIRVDGGAVIKKKINGQYYTMAFKSLFAGSKYDRDTNPNLLPLDSWIGLRSEVSTNADNSVSIKLYVDINRTGTWTLALEATDKGSTYGSAPILNAGYAGIRTDFLDGEFDSYSIKEL